MSYDFESRLTSVTGPGISASYSYNGLDTRISKVENSVSQTFVRDGAYVTDPVLRDSSASYTPGLSSRVGSDSTFMHSGLKNSELQTSSTSAIQGVKTYDAFGNLVASSGTWSGPFGYAGGFGYQEDVTGLKLLGHRYYDSSTGRFLTRDPIKDGRNWYVYCNSNPVIFADPTGLRFTGIELGVGGAFVLGGSLSIAIGINGNGHIMIIVEGGAGAGLVTPGFGVSGVSQTDVTPGFSTGKSATVTVGPAEVEIPFDDEWRWNPDGGIGGGEIGGPVPFDASMQLGAMAEAKLQATLDLSDFIDRQINDWGRSKGDNPFERFVDFIMKPIQDRWKNWNEGKDPWTLRYD